MDRRGESADRRGELFGSAAGLVVISQTRINWLRQLFCEMPLITCQPEAGAT